MLNAKRGRDLLVSLSPLCLAGLLAGGALDLSAEADGSTQAVVGVHHWKTWTNEEGAKLTSVDVVEYSCLQRVRKVFVQLPEGERAMVESILRPERGDARLALELERPSWRLEVKTRLHDVSIEMISPYLYGDVLFWQRLNERGAMSATRTVEVNGAEQLKVPAHVRFPLEHGIQEDLPKDEIRSVLDRTASPEVLVAIRTLGIVVRQHSDSSAVFGPGTELARLLSAGLPNGGVPPSSLRTTRSRWTRSRLEGYGGTRPVEPTVLRFLNEFKMIKDPGNPLAGLHAPLDGGCERRSQAP